MKRFFLPLLAIFITGLCGSCENRRQPEMNYEATVEERDSLANKVMTTRKDGTKVDADITSDTTKITTGNPPIPIFTSDSGFVTLALSSGLLEIRLGELAQTKANSETVKALGRQMITDHSKVNLALKELAVKKHWPPLKYMLARDRAVYNRLSDRHPRQFDQDYAAHLVLEHEKAIAMFEQAGSRAADSDLRVLAAKKLPALREHKEMARALQDQLMKK